MANIKKGENKIKANIIGATTPIRANVSQEQKTIKANPIAIPAATTERKGSIRIAKNEEVIEGTDNSIAITPYTLKLATHYVHEQGIASDTWVINHNLNKKPSVTVVDTADEIQTPDTIIYNNKDTITITFLSEFAGKAYLN